MPIPVFFSPEQVGPTTSFSPSALKPAAVMASWTRLQLPLAVHAPVSATLEELSRAHDLQFVQEVLAGRRDNGFGNRDLRVARTLPWTTGAMVSATRHVLGSSVSVACAPTSGFHHAGWARAAGFCTFNGLVVAALAALEEGLAGRVGIVDCDMHHGDGTEEILERLGDDRVFHWTAGAHFSQPRQAAAFFEALETTLTGPCADCDVVLYQAGADPHVDDPLGGFLTTAQLERRDALVFDRLRDRGVKVVWNLAGGYQVEPDGSIPRVLELHDNTMKACARIFG
jgi:acetoin utilization deacetylase AcuC-like enzyme